MEYRGLTLDGFQSEAISALTAGESVLVCAPTGTGKTLVADWLVERSLAQGKQVIYTAPIKALSNQKFRDYCKLLGEETVGLVTGDLVIRRDAPCRVMTTEILRNILLAGETLPDLAAVIIDEIHFLDDKERGTTWEEVLIYLPQAVQIVGLSATLSNLGEFSAWLEEVRGRTVRVVEEHKRAVPLGFRIATAEHGLLTVKDMQRRQASWQRKMGNKLRKKSDDRRGRDRGRGRGRGRGLSQATSHIDIFHMLRHEHLPYLYFVFSRRGTEELARGLGRHVAEGRPRGLLDYEEREEMEDRLAAFKKLPGAEVALYQPLERLYQLGIAFHHAGLHVMLKAFVEELYEAKLLKVLYCTSTFALGINMPARSAVFDGLFRYDGKGMIPLPTREFMQMAGRAGRRGMDDEGTVVIRTTLEDYPQLTPQLTGYLNASYEPVRSRFSLSLNSVVNLLSRHDSDRIRQIVERSFLAFFRDRKAKSDISDAKRLEQQLLANGWDGEHTSKAELKHKVKKLNRLKRRALSGKDATWAEFEERVQFLVDCGYLQEDLTFNAGAIVLSHVQIQEMFTTELVLGGFFESMEIDVLFGVLCGMCSELPRGVGVPESRKYKGLGRRIAQVQVSDVVTAAEELTGLPTTWDHQLIVIGQWWAQGRSLGEILERVVSPTDISGSLVGAFRRGKDLAGQLRDVWREEHPERAEALRDLIRSVSRDEVEVVD
ncbi:MAG: DEAD/DEAH box helicase [Myxococcota bacterium]|nr:DEAD/DEAH box helicase [Myxococcota bacterium]